MHTTYVQAYEDQAAAVAAAGKMATLGYKVLLITDSDQAQLWGFPKSGPKDPLIVGDIDNLKVFVMVATKDTITPSGAAI